MTRRSLRVLTLMFVSAGPLAAQQATLPQPWDGMIRQMLTNATAHVREQQGALKYRILDSLPPQGDRGYALNLEANGDYVVEGVCDEDCEDLNLRLWESDAASATAAVFRRGDTPGLRFRAPRSGRYILRVYMVDCVLEPCYFGVEVHKLRSASPTVTASQSSAARDAAGAGTSAIAPPSSARVFWFVHPNDPRTGRRDWSTADGKVWVERYPSGARTIFEAVRRATVVGASGTVVRPISTTAPGVIVGGADSMEVFVPDAGSPRGIYIRYAGRLWSQFAEIKP